jgi:hypothetical protein
MAPGSPGAAEATPVEQAEAPLALAPRIELIGLGDVYDAKRREQRERKHAYAHAIHETGARLTHDVKNLLQSLQALCAAADSSDGVRAVELQALMRRQLPQIAQRLERTLEKLARPQLHTMTPVDASRWWQALQRRVDREGVHLSSRGVLDGKTLVFANVIAASGARYASGQYVWWTKGPTGFLTDETLPAGRNPGNMLYRDCNETTR